MIFTFIRVSLCLLVIVASLNLFARQWSTALVLFIIAWRIYVNLQNAPRDLNSRGREILAGARRNSERSRGAARARENLRSSENHAGMVQESDKGYKGRHG